MTTTAYAVDLCPVPTCRMHLQDAQMLRHSHLGTMPLLLSKLLKSLHLGNDNEK